MPDPFIDLTHAPEAAKQRAKKIAAAELNKDKPDNVGVAARLILNHSYLNETLLAEVARGTTTEEIIIGFINYLAPVVANLALLEGETHKVVCIIAEALHTRAHVIVEHNGADGMAVTKKDGVIRDFDFRDHLGRPA